MSGPVGGEPVCECVWGGGPGTNAPWPEGGEPGCGWWKGRGERKLRLREDELKLKAEPSPRGLGTKKRDGRVHPDAQVLQHPRQQHLQRPPRCAANRNVKTACSANSAPRQQHSQHSHRSPRCAATRRAKTTAEAESPSTLQKKHPRGEVPALVPKTSIWKA